MVCLLSIIFDCPLLTTVVTPTCRETGIAGTILISSVLCYIRGGHIVMDVSIWDTYLWFGSFSTLYPNSTQTRQYGARRVLNRPALKPTKVQHQTSLVGQHWPANFGPTEWSPVGQYEHNISYHIITISYQHWTNKGPTPDIIGGPTVA